jgi:hypothetical protein
MYRDNKYADRPYPLPDFENTPVEEKKKPEWFLACSEYFYSLYLQDKTAIPASYASKFQLMRLYGAGKQPSDFYRKKLAGNANQSTSISTSTLQSDRVDRKKGWDNIDFENIVSIMPLIKSILLPSIKNIDYDISCDAIDPNSGSEEERKMWRKWTKVDNGPALDALAKQFGIPVEVDDVMPDDFQDLKQIRAEGGFKAEHSIEVEELIRFTENVSGWDEHLYRDIINEVLDNGYACGYECYDAETKMSKWHHVLIEDIIKQHSKSHKFEDSDYEGVFMDYSISSLRTYFPDKTKEEWMAIANSFRAYTGSEIYYGNNKTSLTTNQYFTEPFDDQRIPVIYFRWNDVENTQKKKYKNEYGKERTQDYKKGDNVTKKEKLITHRRRVSKTCKWVIGTNLIFEEGDYPNQPVENTKPISFIKIYKYPYEAITWRLKTIMDQLQIAWLKYQNALSTSFQGGIAINMSMIKAVADQMKGDELDMVRMMFERGILPFTQNPIGLRQGGGPESPVVELPSNVVKTLVDYITIIEKMLILVEKFTGLSPIALGAAPIKDQAVGTSEMSYSSTMKSLIDVVDGCKIVKQGLAEYSAERLRILFEVDEEVRNVYASIIGDDGVDLIRQARKRNVQYGYKLVARPTDMEKQALIEYANTSTQLNQQGKPGINEGQRTNVLFMLSSGVNLKMISRYMSAWIKKDEKVKQKMTIEREQAQTQSLMQLEDKKNQNFMMQLDAGLKKDTTINDQLSQNKIKEIVVQEDEKRKTERMKKNEEYKKSLKEQENAVNSKV